MNQPVKNTIPSHKIFTVTEAGFEALAIDIFQFQYQHNEVYHQYCNLIHADVSSIKKIEQIPFLPIQFFKSHKVITTSFEPEIIFESSGTTQTITSRHLVKETSIYTESFLRAFDHFYGDHKDWCILALLPAYLERQHSSLVLMADVLIKESNHKESGFYLYDVDALHQQLKILEAKKQKTLLLGVTFALLDFAEKYPMALQHTTVMETGGMKGRKEEMTRAEVHKVLAGAFQKEKIHSEYGMTELLSQAYSKGDGLFSTPAWMKVLIREEDDPFAVTYKSDTVLRGGINVIDLANIYSCSFIAIEDAGKLYADGSFEVLGRLDNTDVRGCSLLAL